VHPSKGKPFLQNREGTGKVQLVCSIKCKGAEVGDDYGRIEGRQFGRENKLEGESNEQSS
jgi:hypothetical protein